MAAPCIRMDYDAGKDCASCFTQSAEGIRGLLNSLQRQMDVLSSGAWRGRGADAFYAELKDFVLPSVGRLAAALEEACRCTGTIAERFQAAEREAGALFVGGDEGEVRFGTLTDQFVRFSPTDSQKTAQSRSVHCSGDHVALPYSMIDDIRAEIGDLVWSVEPPAYGAPAFGEPPPAIGCIPLSIWHSYLQKLGIVRTPDEQNANYNAQISALATIALK